MTKDTLVQKLQDIEWEDFEVKLAENQISKDSWKTVSSFSNTSGGWLLYGIQQKAKKFIIVGVNDPEKIETDFLNTLRGNKFNYPITPKCEKHIFANGTVLAFYIPLSDKKPIYYGNPENTFIRKGSRDVRASQEEIDAMFRDQAYGTLSSRVIENSSLNDLNIDSFDRYRNYMVRFNPSHNYNRLTQIELLRKLQIFKEEKITYSGLLAFGNNDRIQDVFNDFRIDLLEIPGTSYANAEKRYTYRLEEYENVWEYYFGLFDRLRKRLDLPFELSGEGFAVEKFPHLEAVREALVNMLMHTDYFSPEKPRIRVFDDRIELRNPGSLPKSVEELISSDLSIPRNPILAKIFRAVRLAENAGFGFDKMINGWKSYYNSEPDFETDTTSTIVTLRFDTYWTKTGLRRDQDEASIHKGSELLSAKPAPSWNQDGTKTALSWNEVAELLHFCFEPRFITEIMKIFGWKDRTKFRNRYINPLIERHFIEMTIPDKPTSGNQKYLTSEKGRETLENYI